MLGYPPMSNPSPPASTGFCASCGTALSAGARFCHRCGTAVQSSQTGRRERVAWIIAGAAMLVLVAVVLWRGGSIQPAAAPDMAGGQAGGGALGGGGGAGGGQAPDISNMSPEERFERLWDRVIRAAESGDTTTVAQFAPMALGAYDLLPQVNTDLRFHAALIRLAINDYSAARALADTILREAPGHLFGYIIRGEAADRENQLQALNQSYRDFLDHYDEEQRAGRTEYEGHKPLIEDFRTRARAAAR